jgi:hypothetical protein
MQFESNLKKASSFFGTPMSFLASARFFPIGFSHIPPCVPIRKLRHRFVSLLVLYIWRNLLAQTFNFWMRPILPEDHHLVTGEFLQPQAKPASNLCKLDQLSLWFQCCLRDRREVGKRDFDVAQR